MKLLLVQRRDAIKSMLLEKGSITINEVIDAFGISVETARRDFDALADEGFLDKVYGGATLKKRTSASPSRELMSRNFSDGKARMARRAVHFIHQGDTIFMDNSDTVYHMCSGIMEMDITVLTNSLQVMNALAKSTTVKLIGVGGRYQADKDAFFGPMASGFLRQFQVDRAFLSCRSLDLEHGIGAADEILADLKKTAIHSTQQVCLLADHSKFSRVSFANAGSLADINVLFTDELLSDDWKAALEEHDIHYFECLASGDVQQEANFY